MSAQPVHEEPDPRDPQVIHDRLPESQQATFLAAYHEAVDGAHDFAGYRALQRVLTRWQLLVDDLADPDYHEALNEARTAAEFGLSIEQVGAMRHTA